MFNLLVRFNSWPVRRATFQVGRLFEFTDDEVAASFQNGDRINLERLIRLPCIFMEKGTDNQLARVGSITHAQLSGREIIIEYTYDVNVPPLLNSDIFANKTDFDTPHDSEFSRSHWAVKDVDLYRILIRNIKSRRQRPTVFDITEHEQIEPSLLSAMMPFDAPFTLVYETIKQAAEKVGLLCRRADDIWENPAIIQDIVSLIDRSRVVICDCTNRNPNVFYEIGIAHTLGRDVILITQNANDIPFDLRHLRYVQYLNNAEGRQALAKTIQQRLKTIIGV